MPLCEITTNVTPDDAQALSAEAAGVVAQLLSKPLAYVMAMVHVNPSLTFGGNGEPAAYVSIGSIGAVGGDKNKAIVAGVTELVGRALGVDASRTYVGIQDIPRTDFGLGGRTFE
ncbi:hypothetical protein GGF46_004808 [Coemansia sp. RSA 552]|nr:hypothetical protein GGF46_004808 [Coemansia sp. RSA 552]